ncbi:MAG: long-chain fatty acid--CoA ligase, partial [Syntrophobacterales bacterium]
MADIYSQKPWLKFYDSHVPQSLEYPEKSYTEVFREAAELVPDRVAVYYMGKGITFRELDILSNR